MLHIQQPNACVGEAIVEVGLSSADK